MNLEMEVLTPSEKLRDALDQFKRDFVVPARWSEFDMLVTMAMSESATKAVEQCNKILDRRGLRVVD